MKASITSVREIVSFLFCQKYLSCLIAVIGLFAILFLIFVVNALYGVYEKKYVLEWRNDDQLLRFITKEKSETHNYFIFCLFKRSQS